ncbi:hypothetical protein ACQCVO_14950 [Bacillus infantis]|uniref:hypothetical protein n=1 Tax=Bacillus infantis TaxID=324767 RepID=UPI003CF450BB
MKEGWSADVIVVDRQELGLTRRCYIRLVKPKKVVYVSCNPSTLAKDIAVLAPEYRVEYMQPVDMFPQTAHVEIVSNLILK